MDAFSRCQYQSIEGAREKFKMPPSVADDYLAQFKFVKTTIPKALVKEVAAGDAKIQLKRKEEMEQMEEAHAKKKQKEEVSDPATCLEGLIFALHSTKHSPLDKDALAEKISNAGGKLVGSVTKTVTHVISTETGAANGGAPIREAYKKGLPVVKEGFLDACIAEGRRCSEKSYLLAGNASMEEEGGKRKGEGKTIKVMVKGKGAVDVDSGLADTSHVLEVRGSVYSATLSKTDLASDVNSYYVLQIIESDTGNVTHLFKKWGRIGTKQGNHKCTKMSKHEAIEEFEAGFKEKTGNEWADRTPDRFQKKAGFFSVMELGIAADKDKANKAPASQKPSKLPTPVADLVSLITDQDIMKQTMMEMEIDLNKMPLGALSRAQIEKGYEVI